MPLRVTRFTDEWTELAAFAGEPEAQLRAQDDYHEEDREHWLAWDGERVVGAMHPWRRPDGRHSLYFDRSRADAYGALAGAVGGECFAALDGDDLAAIEGLTAAGFGAYRREDNYTIPVRRIDALIPEGLRIVTADATELEPLMLLDCALREDVPGADGWQPDPVWFREETYDSPFFDPLTYRVALDGADYVGLARVWLGPHPQPRLGLVGVLAPYRRRGLARALIAAAFAPLVERGETTVIAEADATNVASQSLLTSLGAKITGGIVELRRPSRG